MPRVGFTGACRGMTPEQIKALRVELKNASALHHGDCIGADAQAFEEARSQGIRTIAHPPDIERLRAHTESDEVRSPKPYLLRNHDIVEESDRLIACPGTEQEILRGSGTWATIRYARRIRKEVTIIYPDGDVT